jgi:hypothetical protein
MIEIVGTGATSGSPGVVCALVAIGAGGRLGNGCYVVRVQQVVSGPRCAGVHYPSVRVSESGCAGVFYPGVRMCWEM